ncbi:hypothetical protein ACSA9R_000520 [Escherichia coli]|uniref:hypothetical protein n=1 Tax=Escherichia coli TaxID=562 RepID=UPI000774C992|nr:hypothetical protein [Escherichia coli]EEV9969636.1 hypothetical protein [Escherichia coli]EFB1875153.1 hypothetical protein [Escherichia coli]EFB3371799.1 hypothetical protein [Escherichia coli]EFB6237518.1 hypothetical protein [Escherichia coli]EFB9514360.1 hypothetical protein [Escherichia coli]
MKQMSLIEMDGFLKGKCIPRDLKVNETNAEYLVRKFAEAEAKISALYEDHQKAIESIKQADAAVKLAHEKFSALAAENEALKSNLIYWGGEDSEPVRSPLDYAHEARLKSGEEFEMQVAARMPNLTYRVVSSSRFKTEIELIGGLLPETPATNAFLAEVRAQGVEMFSEKFGGGTLLSSMVKETAKEFSAQLRKGGNK